MAVDWTHPVLMASESWRQARLTVLSHRTFTLHKLVFRLSVLTFPCDELRDLARAALTDLQALGFEAGSLYEAVCILAA